MVSQVYRYELSDDVPMEDVEATIVIALASLESLHGDVEVQLAAPYYLDVGQRTCIVDASAPIGRDFARLLAGLLRREFGPTAYRVQRVGSEHVPAGTAA